MIDTRIDKALVLFSGGFDSTAVVLKILNTYNYYKELHLLFENSGSYQDYLEDAKDIISKLKPLAKEKDVKLILKVENFDSRWFDYRTEFGEDTILSRDFCLMNHLNVLWRKGEYNHVYLGWNRSNIQTLKYSSVIYNFMVNNKSENYEIYMLENLFLEEDEHDLDVSDKGRMTKRNVIKYLLEHNMFSVCKTGAPIDIDKWGHWWNGQDSKWKEVVYALVDLGFDAKELSEVFNNPSLEEVQRVWNKRQSSKTLIDKVFEEVEV